MNARCQPHRAKPNHNPLERVRAFIPVEDIIILDAMAKARGVTTNALIRESVREWPRLHAAEALEASA